MLFDLRSGGRRRTVKVVYLALALLMFVGFVGFGIGTSGLGGLGDLFSSAPTGGGDEAAVKRLTTQVQTADRRATAAPTDPEAWSELALGRLKLARLGDNFDPVANVYTAAGQRQLTAAGAAWDKYVALDPPTPDERLARQMVGVFAQELNQPDKAVSAQEVLTEIDPTQQTFQNLALVAYQAGQLRKGDLAAEKAIDLAPKEEQKDLKAQLDQAKSQSALQQIQETAPSPTPTVG